MNYSKEERFLCLSLKKSDLKIKRGNMTQGRTLLGVKAGEEFMAMRRHLSLKMGTSKK